MLFNDIYLNLAPLNYYQRIKKKQADYSGSHLPAKGKPFTPWYESCL